MKDPAVLFYFQDFLVGTEFMTDEETGKYIRILCHQADKGALSKIHLERICGGKIPDAIIEKLKQNGDGKYYQERMKIEKEKRVNYSESRRKNRVKKDNKICKTYDIHMENENEDINININKEEKKVFDIFRKDYLGTKRGNDIEFTNFLKKHKDWKEVLPLLSERLIYQKEARQVRRANKLFVPEWKNLQTWINQRCWEEQINTEE